MKPLFFNIPDQKRDIIIDACIVEFGTCGYEKSSTDSIIKRAGISKGGLYEYISSKEELFLYVFEHAYKKLYDYIRDELTRQNLELPSDILERFKTVSGIAIDFYIDHPAYIRLIARTYRLNDHNLREKTQMIFMKQFNNIFGTINSSRLRYSKSRLTDLLIWLLAKTRDEFIDDLENTSDLKKLKQKYKKNWDFYLSVLETGIYK
jgi:TetR/AcrR family transcriptional regulator